MLFLSIMLSMFVSSSDTVNVSKEHTLQEVVVVASRIRNKGNKIIVQMREDEKQNDGRSFGVCSSCNSNGEWY